MEIKELTAEQLMERRSAIAAEVETDGADLTALEEEVRSINEELEARKAAEAKKAEIRNAVANGEGETIEKFEKEEERKMEMTINSREYTNAWLRSLRGEELEPETRAAYIATTANTAAVIPSEMLNNIWNLVNGRHALLADIETLRSGCSIDIVKHTAIAQGAAAAVNEGAANSDEQNTLVKVTLAGQDYSKHIDLSYATMKMAIPAFQAYIEKEIADGIADAYAGAVVTRIGSDMANDNAIATSAGTAISYDNLLAAFGSLKRAQKVVIYGSRKSIYTDLMAIKDGAGNYVFDPVAMKALGAEVKVEDAVADGKLLIGDPALVMSNIIEDVVIEQAKDIKKHVVTISGYLRAEACLVDSLGFATITATPAT